MSEIEMALYQCGFFEHVDDVRINIPFARMRGNIQAILDNTSAVIEKEKMTSIAKDLYRVISENIFDLEYPVLSEGFQRLAVICGELYQIKKKDGDAKGLISVLQKLKEVGFGVELLDKIDSLIWRLEHGGVKNGFKNN